MQLKHGLAACLLTVSAQAAAADWWWVGTFGSEPIRVNAYIEEDSSVSDERRYVRAWLYTHLETVDVSGERSARTLTRFDCQRRRTAPLQRTAYDSNGHVLRSTQFEDEEWSTVAPDTMGDAVMRIACEGGTPYAQNITDPLAHSVSAFTGGEASASAKPEQEGRAAGGEDAGQLSYGTGFFVGPTGLVLTSHHVVENAGRIACRTPDGRIHAASVARASPANDLALLQVDAHPGAFLGLAPPGSLHAGDRVFTVGYPVVDILGANEPRFTDGTVSALSGPGGENAYMQISVPVQPGNSGGPLLNESGQVVGVVAAQAAVDAFLEATGTLPQSINWAVKAEYASPLVGAAPPAPRRTREAAIALARSALCLIVAEG